MSELPGIFVPDWINGNIFVDPSRREAGTFIPDWIRPRRMDLERSPEGKLSLAEGNRRPILLKGGNCVIPAKGIFPLDLYISGGKIAAMGKGFSEEGCEVINVHGKYLLPGVIDPHTHIGIFAPFEKEIVTETRSAVLNGVTTLGVYLSSRQSYIGELEKAIALIGEKSFADLFIHLPIFTEQQLSEIPTYSKDYGIKSFKAYMCGIPGMIPSLDEGFLLELMDAVRATGPEAVLNIHAENYHIVEWATRRSEMAHRDRITLEQWQATHPGFSEAEAIQRAVFLSKQSGVTLYFVHVSSAESVDLIRDLKRNGNKFFAETTSPYLSMTSDSTMKALAKMVPPVRSEYDRAALWKAVSEDLIDTIGTDHTPLTVKEKNPTDSLWDTIPGYPAVGTHLPLLLDNARRTRLPLEKLVEKICLNPARLFGLYPSKGTIMPGSDADIIVVDLLHEETVTAEKAASRADFVLRGGDRIIGWPVLVLKGGEVVSPERITRESLPKSRYLRR